MLPLAIRIRHDTIDPELSFSPYQLVFGRDRPGFGLPWAVPRESLEARAWFEKREQEERELGDKLRKRIADQLRRALDPKIGSRPVSMHLSPTSECVGSEQ